MIKISRKYFYRGMKCMLAVAVVTLFPAASRAQLIVDCSGSTPGAFTTINAAVFNAGPDSTILVSGPCSEDLYLSGKTNLFLGSWWTTNNHTKRTHHRRQFARHNCGE
jgi:hypothetical protein